MLANVYIIMLSNFDKALKKVKHSRFHLTGLNFSNDEYIELLTELKKIYKLNVIDLKSRIIQ